MTIPAVHWMIPRKPFDPYYNNACHQDTLLLHFLLDLPLFLPILVLVFLLILLDVFSAPCHPPAHIRLPLPRHAARCLSDPPSSERQSPLRSCSLVSYRHQ